MAASWSLTASEICADALEHLGIMADGETASSGDMQLALKALNGVLKELALFGLHWPLLSGEVALPWVSGQVVALPADYYGWPVVWQQRNGARELLLPLPRAEWVTRDRTGSGIPSHYYIAPNNQLLLWPIPAADPVLTLQYQRVIADADLSVSPQLLSYWVNPLGYGVANELVLKFGTPQDKRVEIAQRWDAKRVRALESAIASETLSFGVAD